MLEGEACPGAIWGALVLHHFSKSGRGSLSPRPAARWAAGDERVFVPSDLRPAALRWRALLRACRFLVLICRFSVSSDFSRVHRRELYGQEFPRPSDAGA